ncbi:excalibur calcium-binding domain-containing protein [[Mycobacterium] wendilense]|uniref:Excalibur calcium-binding domain-containing protein n=1 Tax=[Mycobacterium] wendilense TaxID=3064284 RepID=A0ABM9MG85_9MYCO|nr:excalibur calcium-binding domain-containing protein [Mycolicibacterium sp. MU0050]CAJ1584399.1 excalibur calcium-binding domain-containing protein [Mycolicibacterium sp. MU0050]
MFRPFVAAVVIAGVAILAAPVAAAAPFKNCTEARSNGYSNIPSSSEYYGPHLDRDGDGIGCES